MIPRMAANKVAANTSRSVTGIARARESATADPSRPMPKLGFPIKTPKTPLSHKKYLSGGGTSSCSSRVKEAMR